MGWENAGIYLVLLGIAVILVVLVLGRRLLPRLESRPGTFGEPETRAKEELERLVVEIREAAREELARLDTQMRLLRQLLTECDHKAKELRTLLGTPPGGPAAPAPAGSGNPLHQQVYALRDAGRDIPEISAATGLEKGEIELILGLRRPPSLKAPGGGPATA